MDENTNHPEGGGPYSPHTPDFEGVAKGPEKKGTTKTRRHKVFFLGLSELRSAGKKSLPLCLRVFVVQGFLPFATLSFAGVAKEGLNSESSHSPSFLRRRGPLLTAQTGAGGPPQPAMACYL